MRVQQLEVTDVPTNNFADFAGTRRASGPREVLEEVFELLEDYGPIFYTEDLHNRIVAALMPRQM
jgi:hypothetical protein